MPKRGPGRPIRAILALALVSTGAVGCTDVDGLTAPGCSLSTSPSSLSLPSTFSSGIINVNAAGVCPWTATSSTSWLTLGGRNGEGSGSFSYSASANPNQTTSRTASISLGSLVIPVTQSAITPPCSLIPVSIPTTVAANLSTADCFAPHRTGARADVYTFTASAGRATTIEMVSTFDNLLILVGPNGTVIASDDDSFGGLNARIVINLPSTGTYNIEATTSGTSGNVVGNYTLTVR